MARSIVLSIPEHDVGVIADLLDVEAPSTCELIWRCLPVEGRLGPHQR